MKAMILGAGIGSRLDPLTRSLPKPIVPIVGKPVMGHLVDLLRKHGIEEIMVNVQYLGHKIEAEIGDGSAYGVRVHYSREDKLWGDAGGVKRVESFFRDGSDDTFLVIGGDDLTDTDIGAVVSTHRERRASATIGVTPVDDPSEFGVAVTDADNRITHFQEKPKPGEARSHLANTGIYVFDVSVFDRIPAETFYGFGKDVLPGLLEAGETLVAVPSQAYWKDVGNLTIYRQAQRDCIDGKVSVDLPVGARRIGTCVVCAGATVDGQIDDYTVVGAGAVVEPGAVVRNSILWNRAVVRSGTTLENCVVGEDVVVQSTHAIFNGLCVEPHRPS